MGETVYMGGHFYALISRMRNIRRWGLMENSFEENIQEHSLMVAVLAHGLAVIRRDIFHGEADPEHAAACEHFQEATEIFTGDLPTPVKYFNPEISKAYKQVERLSLQRLMHMLPEVMRPAYGDLLYPERWDETTRELLRGADKLAAYLKCMEELRAGNGDFKRAAEQTREALEAMKLPEIQYFLREFAPSFSLTLDEQE